MRAIYKPAGRAAEYAELACNLFTGCPHGCVYCYVPQVLRRRRETFMFDVRPRPGILEALERDCRNLPAEDRDTEILFCFMCDPWPRSGPMGSVPAQHLGVLHGALDIVQGHGLRGTTLTKAGMESAGSLSHFAGRPGLRYGATLSMLAFQLEYLWEPLAATATSRLQALGIFHDAGVETWVSVEPVLAAGEALAAIEAAAPWTDEFRLGKLNHMSEVERQIDWRDYATRAVALCETLGKRYYVKSDLARYLDPR